MTYKLLILLSAFTFLFNSGHAQSLNHPTIWVTAEDRPEVLETAKKYDWAKSIVAQLHERVDTSLKIHQTNPGAILTSIPVFAKRDNENPEAKASPIAEKHNRVLALASESAMLYYLTEDEQYAQFAADILAYYIDHIAPLTPQTTTISGYAFFDPRTTYGPLALTYDFIYNFLKKPGTMVYSKAEKSRVTFDNNKAQKAMLNVVGNVLQEYGKPDKHGQRISNHPILTATGALFGILCIEDDVERNRLFNVFWEKGTAHQNSFKHTILPMFGEQGIWPESTSYGFMPIITLVLNIVDRHYPEMNVTKDYQYILEGNFLFDHLRHPDRRFVKYGDSKRNNDGTQELYRYTLGLAKRRGYNKIEKQAEVALRQAYNATGGYKPVLSSSIFNNFEPLQLFWGEPIPEQTKGSIDFNKPTVIIKHAGVALQRNYVEKNNELYGLCGIIGGAHYVHSHLTGISMELYGAGYVMAPNAGLPPTVPERQIPLHENYFRLYAGNNTVIINGTSHGRDEGSWKGKANVWQNTAVNVAAEPKHLENPISPDFSFATQFLNDEVNNASQQRTLGIIRTSETTGYYVDIFRSKSLGENKFHDYVYHNIGDATQLSDAKGIKLTLKNTDRYQNDVGDEVQAPGWRYFEQTNVSNATSDAVNVRFDVNFDNRFMHMFVPSGVKRDYATALAPPTREAKNGYVEKKTQVLIIRQEGEAWDKPFISVFEPSTINKSSVKSVMPLIYKKVTVGGIVTSEIKGKQIVDYVINNESAESSIVIPEFQLAFEGRYAIVRQEIENKVVRTKMYIGEGEKLTFRENVLTADATKSGVMEVKGKDD